MNVEKTSENWYGKENRYHEPVNSRGGLSYLSVHKGTTWKTQRFADRRKAELKDIIETFGRANDNTFNSNDEKGLISRKTELFFVFRTIDKDLCLSHKCKRLEGDIVRNNVSRVIDIAGCNHAVLEHIKKLEVVTCDVKKKTGGDQLKADIFAYDKGNYYGFRNGRVEKFLFAVPVRRSVVILPPEDAIPKLLKSGWKFGSTGNLIRTKDGACIHANKFCFFGKTVPYGSDICKLFPDCVVSDENS